MPIAAATMPPSAIGVSSTRCSPYLRCSPSVQRNTPPKKPMSSPMMTTRGSRSSMMSIAELSAWTMFMCAMALTLFRRQSRLALELLTILFRCVARMSCVHGFQLRALTQQVRRGLCVHIVEHRARVELRTVGECPVAHGLLPAGTDVRIELLLERRVPLRGPLAEGDQMSAQAVN